MVQVVNLDDQRNLRRYLRERKIKDMIEALNALSVCRIFQIINHLSICDDETSKGKP
jgi:hypothetical protein